MPTGSARFSPGIAAPLAGGVGRALLVACALVCGLLSLDALFSGLEWALTHDRRASEDAAGFLAGAAVLLVLTVAGALARERLRRALEIWRARRLAEADPWPTRQR